MCVCANKDWIYITREKDHDLGYERRSVGRVERYGRDEGGEDNLLGYGRTSNQKMVDKDAKVVNAFIPGSSNR